MTAVEVLAATILSSLMLAATVGVLGGLSRQQKILRSLDVKPPWSLQLQEQLSWDLRNSRQQVAIANGIRLIGYAGRDFASGQPTGRPTAIEYLIYESDTERWLLRREVHLDDRSNKPWRSEVLCRDVARMEWDSMVVGRANLTSLRELTGGLSPTRIPESVAVKLIAQDGNATFNEVLIIR